MHATAAAAAVWIISASAASAQWTAQNLHDPAYLQTRLHAITATAAFGEVHGGGIRPAMWQAGLWTSLLPPGRSNGKILGASGNQQVGVVDGMAAVWSGGPESAVILHTAGHYWSEAVATTGEYQVGFRIPTFSPGTRRATVWSGTAGSAVSLHPAGAYASDAKAAAGNLQGGYVSYYPTPTVPPHAVIWEGSAASMIDLHPAGMGGESMVLGMTAGQQVGHVSNRAALWSGTAASFVSLHRPEFGISQLLATCGTAQVGITGSGLTGVFAGVWFGTAESHISLHASLPAGQFAESYATSIAELDGVYYVGGYARRPGGGTEAILWVGIPSPGAAALLAGAGLWAMRRRRDVRLA